MKKKQEPTPPALRESELDAVVASQLTAQGRERLVRELKSLVFYRNKF